MSRTRRKGYNYHRDEYTGDMRDGRGKPCSTEYWAKRADGKYNGGTTGNETKRRTNRYERRKYRQEGYEE